MTALGQDIETALGRTLSTEEQTQAIQWIADALMLIEARLGDPTLLNQDRLDFVVREAVVERMKNPTDVDEESESIDDYSRSWKRSGTKRVTIWPEWWDLLAPRRRRAFSVMPS